MGGDSFGWSVAFDSGTVVVGAHSDNGACTDNPLCNSGSAYVYSLSDAGLVYTKLTAPDAAADDYFGVSVAVDGTSVVVGAGQWLNLGSGSAYVYEEIPQKTASSSQSAYNLPSDAARSLPAAATLLAA